MIARRPLSLLLGACGLLASPLSEARPLTVEERALYLDATDLLWMRRAELPDADESGPALGKAMWISPDRTEAIGGLQELRWVFPDEASADAWLQANASDLSEGMDPANAPRIGDRCYVFGPEFRDTTGAFEGQKPPRMVSYVFRVGRVVVKLFVNALTPEDKRLTPLLVSPLAGTIAERVREAQKSLGTAAPATGGTPRTSVEPAMPTPPAPSPSPPPAPASAPPPSPTSSESSSDDPPARIFVFDAPRYSLFGRYAETTNLLNQPDRAAGLGGLEVAFPLFSGGAEDTTGFAFHDALDLELSLGMRTSADFETSAGTEDLWAYGYFASYSLAVGYRFESLGLLAGARPMMQGHAIGGITASDPQVPLMALLEVRFDDDVLVAARGHYGFFLDQNAAGLSVYALFADDLLLRFSYDQYRASTAVPSDVAETAIQVGRQVSTFYTLGFGSTF